MDFLEKAPDFEVPRSLTCTYYSQKKKNERRRRMKKRKEEFHLWNKKIINYLLGMVPDLRDGNDNMGD